MDTRVIFTKNFCYLLNSTGNTRQELTRILKIPYSTIDSWYKGLSYPRPKNIEKIANYFCISVRDLLTSDLSAILKQSNVVNNSGAIVTNSNLNQSKINIQKDADISPQIQELINIYKHLDARKQIRLLSYAFELESKDCQ